VQHYRAYLSNNFILGDRPAGPSTWVFNAASAENSATPKYLTRMYPAYYLQLNTYSYDVKYFLPEFDRWSLSLGVNGMYQDNKVDKGSEFVIPSYHQFDIGPFALFEKRTSASWISPEEPGLTFVLSRTSPSIRLPNPITGFDMPVYGADTAGADFHFAKL